MSVRFNDSEVKGSIILSIIILFFIATKYFYSDFYATKHRINFDDKILQEQYKIFLHEHKKDINTVKIQDLCDLGIYKNISAKIIHYRDQLGGFISLDQLKEVKNISEQDIKVVNEFTFVSKNFVPRKIKINSDEFKILLKHPYLDYEDVKNICNERRVLKIKNDNELKEKKILSNKKIKKLEAYLSFD